jgi:hypothetical protein
MARFLARFSMDIWSPTLQGEAITVVFLEFK